jgi:hypothetical protein
MVVNRQAGLWTKKYEIGDCFDQKKEDIYIVLRSIRNDEYNKLLAVESDLFTNSEKFVEINYVNNEGKEEIKKINPDGLLKRKEFLADLLPRCIIDHNFYSAGTDKQPEKKLNATTVWEWICDRPNLAEFIMNDWRVSLPLDAKRESE